MKTSTKYKEINIYPLDRKALRNFLRIFPKMVLFQLKVFGA